MNTTFLFIVLGLLIVLNTAAVLWVALRKSTPAPLTPQDDTSQQLLNQNMQGLSQRMDSMTQGLSERMDTVAIGMNQRLDKAAQVISEVTKELGSMQEIGRNMQGLQEFLRSPKLRGNIGEKVLEQMLEQFFPKSLFSMQYRFRTGEIVDAIIQTDKGIIPIDSKFPLENYQRMTLAETDADRDSATRDFIKDVKKHVNDIAKKYILPGEGTVDFAIMYIPSESVYYEIIRHDIALQMHGIDRKVIFVSPNSLYYFLQVILAGLKEKEVAEAAREIIAAIKGIQVDARKFADQLSILEKHVGNAQTALVKGMNEFGKLSDKIARVDDVSTHALDAAHAAPLIDVILPIDGDVEPSNTLL